MSAQLLSNEIDSSYIATVESEWRIGVNIGTFQDIREFKHSDDLYNHELSTTVEPTLGLILKYKKWPTVKVAIPTPSDNTTEAKTKGFRLSVHANPVQSIVMDVYYNRLKGYNYINLLDIDENTIGYDNLRARNFAVNAFHIFNSDRYSNKHGFDMGQDQLKNAGSWIVGTAVNLTYQKKTARLFKPAGRELALAEFSRIRAFQLAVLGGYAHNWLLGKRKRGFVSFGMFMGPNYHTGNISYLDLASDDFSGTSYAARFQFGIGHKSKRRTHFVFKVLGSFYGYSLPEVDLINRLIDGELRIVKYFDL